MKDLRGALHRRVLRDLRCLIAGCRGCLAIENEHAQQIPKRVVLGVARVHGLS